MINNIKIILKLIVKPAYLNRWGRFCFLFVYISSLGFHQIKAAQPPLVQNYFSIKDLSEEWLVFDDQFKDYVPYIKGRHFNYHSFSQYFDLENYRGYKLFLHSKAQSYLFINGTLQKKLPVANWLSINIDSLYIINKNPNKILLTVYSEMPGIENTYAVVAHKLVKSDAILIENEKQESLKMRTFSNFSNFSILFTLFLFGSVAFLYNFQNSLLEKFISIKDLLTIGKRFDTVVVNRPFDVGNILYLGILSFSASLLLMVLEHNFISVIPKILVSSEKVTFFSLIGQFFNLSFWVFTLYLLKYLFISIFGNLYKLEKITNLHYFKILQSSGIFLCSFGIIVMALIIYPNSPLQNNKSLFLILIVSFYFLRLFLLFFIIIKQVSVKNVYLFSYLCIVELIPLFIGIRFAL